jgi:hypothetical protein
MRYKDFVERIPQGPKASWNDMIRFAKGYGADWVVIDDRYYPHRDGDPKPDFSAGVYHVVKIPRQSKNTSSLRPSLSGGEK